MCSMRLVHCQSVNFSFVKMRGHNQMANGNGRVPNSLCDTTIPNPRDVFWKRDVQFHLVTALAKVCPVHEMPGRSILAKCKRTEAS